ncbi:uncharacterized protein LOC112494518 [Cephus cinctus]|uniref:Uncharacterized protein LOC112494518 n=1 Tax=Cephus cinctus TaxID=211228 RepID=A0AAJ7RJX6_CEPCN|nr:uncharacterized protein LOC112494518 [Cephus cinctus]
MNDVSPNDRNLRVAQSVKIRSRQKNSRGKDKGRTTKSQDPTWTPPYYLLRKWQESMAEYSGTVASKETSHKACKEKDTQSRNDRKSVLKYTEQQAMSRVFTRILSPAVIITRDKLPKSESSNSRTARQFFVCKAKTGALMKGAASEETISRRRDVKDIERIESEGRFLKERMSAKDEVNESSIQRDVVRYEGARKHKRDEEKKRKTTVAIGGSECANSTFAKDIFRIDSAASISATSDNPVQDEAVPFRSYDKKDAECDDDTLKVEDARDCAKVRTSFDLSKVHEKSVEEIVAADVHSDITCSLPGKTSEQLLAPVEQDLPSFGVAQAPHFANRSGLPISIDIKHFIANKESSSCMPEFDRFFEELELTESCKRIPKNKIHPKNVVASTKRSVKTEDWKVLATLVESPKSIVRTVGSDEGRVGRISHEDIRGPLNRKFQVGKNEEDIVTSSQKGLPSTSPREKEVSCKQVSKRNISDPSTFEPNH